MSGLEHEYDILENEFSGEHQIALEGMQTHDVMIVSKPKKMTIIKVPGGYLYTIGDLTVGTFVPEKKIINKQK